MATFIPTGPRSAAKALAVLLTSASLLGGCAHHTALTDIAKVKSIDEYATVESFDSQTLPWPDQQWWQVYGDPQLDQLMQEALANNPDLQAAHARLQQAQALAGLAGSSLKPDVSLNGSVTQQKLTYNSYMPAAYLPQGWNDFGRMSLDLQWDLDFWGQNKDQLAAATSALHAQHAELAQAHLWLTSAVAATYAEFNRLHHNLDTLKRSVQISQQTAALFTQRQQHGLENIGTVKQAEARVASMEGQQLSLEQQLMLLRHQLAALLGAGPDRGNQLERPSLALDVPYGLPEGASINLLARRPDIHAALLRVEAQASQVSVSEKAYYPNINLSAFIGLDALGINQLFEKDSYAGAIGPAIHLPIFNGNRLDSQLAQQQANYQIAVASYNSAVTHALQQVADVLSRQRTLSKRLKKAFIAFSAARQAYQVAKNRYEGGLANYIQVLSAEDVRLNTEQTLTDLIAQAVNLDIELKRVLGGGYQSTTDTAQSTEHDDFTKVTL